MAALTMGAKETGIMLKKVALLAAALVIAAPAFADAPPAPPGKLIQRSTGAPTKVGVKKPVPCNPTPHKPCRK
jgi:hypothetical protein